SAHARGGLPGKASATHLELPRRDQRRQRRRRALPVVLQWACPRPGCARDLPLSAATAIGHHGPEGLLQVYALCAAQPGQALENPRQVSAWKYPRRYGPTAPSFARAMRLPGGALAIS